VFTSIGRIHQLFPVLGPLKPTLVTGAAAIRLYLLQQSGARRISALAAPPTKCLLLLLLWVALSVPGALYPRLAFDLLTDSFIKTVILFVLIVGSVQGFRDVERLAPLPIMSPRHSTPRSCSYVSALPLGLYFALGQHRSSRRVAGAAGLVALSITFVWSGSRGGFLALLGVAAFVLFRFPAIKKTWRVLGTAAVVYHRAHDRQRYLLDTNAHDPRA